jgi:predicted RNA-binding Zn-ribbon protein involved in translation (DUF1610 family)
MRSPSLILRNRARCTHCGQEIESLHRHDFRCCSCGKMAVDGGRDYIRRIGNDWVDTSIVAQVEEDDSSAEAITLAFEERLRTGWRPAPNDYIDAPHLAGWWAHARRLPAGPATVLLGTVTGHSEFSDGTLIATGGVLAGDAAKRWARTTRRYYRLGDSE